MSRIAATFSRLKNENKTALIAYFMAGDPSPDSTVALMHALVDAGADMIELGVPFSDPMADGPAIQAAAERVLKYNISLNDVLSYVSQFRQENTTTPVLLMGYTNPIEVMGYQRFVEAGKKAAIDGLITVDLPPEESLSFTKQLQENDIDPIFLLSPTTSHARIEYICSGASGFVYYVSLKGVTGSASLDVSGLKDRLSEIRTVTQLPLAVGFGIKDPDSAAQVSQVADAAVVGSAIVQRINDHFQDPKLTIDTVSELVASLRVAMDRPLATQAS